MSATKTDKDEMSNQGRDPEGSPNPIQDLHPQQAQKLEEERRRQGQKQQRADQKPQKA